MLQKDPVVNICQAADKQLFTLVEWAKNIPHFTDLPLEDQVILLRAGQFYVCMWSVTKPDVGQFSYARVCGQSQSLTWVSSSMRAHGSVLLYVYVVSHKA